MAMALLAHHLGERGAEARVTSSGTIGWGGPATDKAVQVLAERGIDLTDHTSRRISSDQVRRADLVLGMTRDHVGGVLTHDTDAAHRTFVIGELVRLARDAGPRLPDQHVRHWSLDVAGRRRPGRTPGKLVDEIADPVGESIEVYRSTADRLEALSLAIAELLVPEPGQAADESAA